MHKLLRLAWLCQMFMLTFVSAAQSTPSTQPPLDQMSHWRFAHFGTRSLSLDIYVLDQLSPIQNVSFGDISDWQTISAGVYRFEVYPSGDNANPQFVIDNVVLEGGEWLTLAAVQKEGLMRGYVVEEDFSPLPLNESRLTVFYAIEDSPSVDVRMNGVSVIQASQPQDDEGPITVPSVDLTSDTYNLDIIESGGSENIILDATQVELLPNRHYLAAAVNTSEDPRFVLVGTELETAGAIETDDKALVRAAHLSSGTSAVDIVFNGEIVEALSQIYFPEFTGWIEVDAGSIEVSVQLNSTGEEILPSATIDIPGGSFTTLLVIGSPQNDTLEVQPVQEDFAPVPPNFVRVNVFNAFPGIGAIDFTNADGTVYIERLGYPGFFGGNNGFNTFSLEAGTYDLQIRLNESGESLVDLSGASFYAGRSYFIAAIDADPPYVLTFSDVQETQNLLREEETP